MKCPNCKLPFVEDRAEKYLCSSCGWMEKIGKEWNSCDAPPPGESPTPQEPEPTPEPESESAALEIPAAHEPDPAANEPAPAAHEPDPAAHEPDPAANEPAPGSVKKYLGGLVTVTEVDE